MTVSTIPSADSDLDDQSRTRLASPCDSRSTMHFKIERTTQHLRDTTSMSPLKRRCHSTLLSHYVNVDTAPHLDHRRNRRRMTLGITGPTACHRPWRDQNINRNNFIVDLHQ